MSDFFQFDIVKVLTAGFVELEGRIGAREHTLELDNAFLLDAWVLILREGSYDNCHKWWDHSEKMLTLRKGIADGGARDRVDLFIEIARSPHKVYMGARAFGRDRSALEAGLRGASEGREGLPSFFSLIYLLGWYAFTEMQLAEYFLPMLVQSVGELG
jgi:hypothetical protein